MKTDVITHAVVADRLEKMAKALILIINDDPSLADIMADYHMSRTAAKAPGNRGTTGGSVTQPEVRA